MAVAATNNSGLLGVKSKILSNTAPGMVWAKVNEGSSTGASFSTLTNPNSDGINYRLATFTSAGSLVVSTAGYLEVLVVSPGVGPNGADGVNGPGGRASYGIFYYSAATHTATIGALSSDGLGANGISGASSLGPVVSGITYRTRFGPGGGEGSSGVTLNITGSNVVYCPAADPTKYGGGATTGNPGAGIIYARWQI